MPGNDGYVRNNTSKWRVFSGGMRAAVVRMQPYDLLHRSMLETPLLESLASEAQRFEAPFDNYVFNKVFTAIREDRIQAYFLLVTAENCMPKVVGTSVQFPTVLTKWDISRQRFNHYAAIHDENTYVLPQASADFEPKTAGLDQSKNPELVKFFHNERIRLSISKFSHVQDLIYGGMVAKGRVGENTPHSTASRRIYGEPGDPVNGDFRDPVMIFRSSDVEKEMKRHDSALIEIERLGSPRQKGSCHIEENIFAASWKSIDGRQSVAATFTLGFATYSGQNVVRVQISDNGVLPYDDILPSVLAGLIFSGKNFIKRDSKWFDSRVDIMPFMRIHNNGRGEIAQVLQKTFGAMPRQLGACTMYPNVTEFDDTLGDVLGLGIKIPRAIPFVPIINRRRSRQSWDSALS